MSAPNPGDFTASTLLKLQYKAEQIWKSDTRNADYSANVEVYNAITENQTARLAALQDPDKERIVRLLWLDDCNCDPRPWNEADACTVVGTEAHSAGQDFEITDALTDGVMFREDVWRKNEFEGMEAVSISILRKLKCLDEKIAQKGLAKLELGKGRNIMSNSQYTVDVNGDTIIPPSAINPNLFIYLQLMQIKNKLNTSYLLTDTMLWSKRAEIMANASNPATGSSDASKFDMIKKQYYDLFNFTGLGLDNSAYLVNNDSIAFVSKNRYPGSTVREIRGKNIQQLRNSMPSPNLKGVWYDVHYELECIAGVNFHKWQFIARFDYFLNPAGCNANRTGIVKLKCDMAA